MAKVIGIAFTRLQDRVATGRENVAIKNSKVDNPTFGFLSEVWTDDDDPVLIGSLVCQRATTRRQHWCGENAWEVFAVSEIANTLIHLRIVTKEASGPGSRIELGRWGGSSDFLVGLRKINEKRNRSSRNMD